VTDNKIIPFTLKDAPALIEKLLPVQKLSAEAYKEQMAGSGKTLTALGSYWKGRKPLILNKACILGCLLPATDDLKRDLEIFELLMGMDDASFVVRFGRLSPRQIVGRVALQNIEEYFAIDPPGSLPEHSPFELSDYVDDKGKLPKLVWRDTVSDPQRRNIEALALPKIPYRQRVTQAKRPEEVYETIHEHIWDAVNAHLHTCAQSFPELVEQLGLMRFGHRPRFADTFCGSGQIPFEAARLGCDVYASDLNPIACLLTWGALNIVGGSPESRVKLEQDQKELVAKVQAEIDALGVESDGQGWRAKVFLYCVETRCPQTGWIVPLLPSRVVSASKKAIAVLMPDPENQRYGIDIRIGVSKAEMEAAEIGTIGREGKFGEAYLIHQVDGIAYKTKISTLRGDYQTPEGNTDNRLRPWDKHDFKPLPSDLFQERLYCVQWMRPKNKGKGYDYEFRSVNAEDMEREHIVEAFIAKHIDDWQVKGWIPDMRIEVGEPPRYQGQDLIRARGWTHWNHVFNPRQLLLAGLVRANATAADCLNLAYSLNYLSKLCVWDKSRDNAQNTFYNQALNTIFNYACRASCAIASFLEPNQPSYPISSKTAVVNSVASEIKEQPDILVTDPPYGDAVKYEEILEFFIAWLRKNPPPEFADWVWDSRRSLAIKGEDEDFRRNMVAAYSRMAEHMPDNGIQIIMFTHQSGSIWADMANIVWASGLQVTAAWYVVTETDSALREGSYVKGTVLLVLRKRLGKHKTTRDDLAWEIQEEVEQQVNTLTGLNQQAKGLYRDENLFEEADLQMAGYAAALRVLTRYAAINGKDMTQEASRPRVKGQKTFVDELIEFAVGVANQSLVPQGIEKPHWERLAAVERFYLKLIDLEAKQQKSLDNYQNFAKAFKVRDFHALMGSEKANAARLKSAVELGRAEMSEGSELAGTALRGVLYAMMELTRNVDGSEVLAHLSFNVPSFYDSTQRTVLVEIADYLAKKLESIRPEEASAARVLRELLRNQKL
jgi:putative DNA methylase